jgi:hypothetical protein
MEIVEWWVKRPATIGMPGIFVPLPDVKVNVTFVKLPLIPSHWAAKSMELVKNRRRSARFSI